jgi:hypothetical protein
MHLFLVVIKIQKRFWTAWSVEEIMLPKSIYGHSFHCGHWGGLQLVFLAQHMKIPDRMSRRLTREETVRVLYTKISHFSVHHMLW